MLTKRQKYDYHDVDRGELKLIRIGHYLWRELKRGKSYLPSEIQALQAALETVWAAKREYRSELKAKRAIRAKLIGQRLRGANVPRP